MANILRYLPALSLVIVSCYIARTWTADCSTMTSCDLYTEIQDHSKLIAGFSYNVKKADAALQKLKSERDNATDRLARLESLLADVDQEPTDDKEILNKLKEEDQKLKTEIEDILGEIQSLKDDVSVTFVDTIQGKSEELEGLLVEVTNLNEQVGKIENFVETRPGVNFNPSAGLGSAGQQLGTLKKKHTLLEGQVTVLGKACGKVMDGEEITLDSLGIELETVKSSFEFLNEQVTELQAACGTHGQKLSTMVEELSKRVTALETEGKSGRSFNLLDLLRKKLGGGVESKEGTVVVKLSTAP